MSLSCGTGRFGNRVMKWERDYLTEVDNQVMLWLLKLITECLSLLACFCEGVLKFVSETKSIVTCKECKYVARYIISWFTNWFWRWSKIYKSQWLLILIMAKNPIHKSQLILILKKSNFTEFYDWLHIRFVYMRMNSGFVIMSIKWLYVRAYPSITSFNVLRIKLKARQPPPPKTQIDACFF